MNAVAMRYWCARAQYPGKEPFIFGSAMLPKHSAHHEVEAALLALWNGISPNAPPPFVPVPGILMFEEDREQ